MKIPTFREVLNHLDAVPTMREQGFSLIRSRQSLQYKRDLLEAGKLVKRVLNGDRWAGLLFQEAMTTSDFPYLFGDILDRSLLSNYMEAPYTWNLYAKRGTIRDFRIAKRFRVDYGAGVLDEVGQEEEYPERKRQDNAYEIQLRKHGARMPFAWEVMINDDLDALKDTPDQFGRAARRSEEKAVTVLFAGQFGDGKFYSNANKNIVDSANLPTAPAVAFQNPELSVTGLQNALLTLASQVDKDGEPIGITAVTLVVPPALEVTANNILNALSIAAVSMGGDANATPATGYPQQTLQVANWLRNKMKLAVNYYLPIVDTTQGNKAWYLFADPNNGRPALEFDFLRGNEQPAIFMKSSNSIRVGSMSNGGGLVSPMEGDFDTDSIHYKVRHVYGGAQIDPIMTVGSKGTNAA